jgi:hypothetical protein
MKTRFIEIRDSATCIPVLGLQFDHENDIERAFAGRVGFGPGNPSVIIMRLYDQKAHSDPYDWLDGSRTMRVAHQWIQEHWHLIKNSDVVDVRQILKETDVPAKAEIFVK